MLCKVLGLSNTAQQVNGAKWNPFSLKLACKVLISICSSQEICINLWLIDHS